MSLLFLQSASRSSILPITPLRRHAPLLLSLYIACFLTTIHSIMPPKQTMTLQLVHKKHLLPHPLQQLQKEAVKQVILSDTARINNVAQNLRRVLTVSPSPQPADSQFQTVVISGSSMGLGEYFVNLDVGTPPQRQLLVMDTGSDLTWVKCSPCPNCNSSLTMPIFNPNMSSSFNSVHCWSSQCQLVSTPPYCLDLITKRCNYNSSYADQSISTGFLIHETVTLESRSGTSNIQLRDLAMGCTNKVSGQTFSLSGGVLGLGQGPLSFTSQAGQAYGNKFSYCLSDLFSPPTVASSLTFGESLSVGSTLQFTPLLRNPYVSTFYYVAVEEVRVDGTLLPIPAYVWNIDPSGNGGTIVDSGTTLAHFSEIAYEIILVAFESAISYPRTNSTNGLELCYNLSGVSMPHFPEFSITFAGNATFQPPQENHFIDVEHNIKCLAIQGVTSSYGVSIIGNFLQQNFHMEFDRSRNRVGFSRTNCALRS